jgi:hypothetical protein
MLTEGLHSIARYERFVARCEEQAGRALTDAEKRYYLKQAELFRFLAKTRKARVKRCQAAFTETRLTRGNSRLMPRSNLEEHKRDPKHDYNCKPDGRF